jgi:hypothetical protein
MGHSLKINKGKQGVYYDQHVSYAAVKPLVELYEKLQPLLRKAQELENSITLMDNALERHEKAVSTAQG